MLHSAIESLRLSSINSSTDVLQWIAERPALIGRSGKQFDNLSSQSTVNNLFVLQSLMKIHRPKATLEIGFAHGASAAVIAACHREQAAVPRGQHVAVDPYERTVWDDSGRLTLQHHNLDGYVSVKDEFSDAALPRLIGEGWQCDLAYIDGSHLFEDVFIDFYFVNLLLRKNGIVLFDDSTDPHVRKALRFIRRNRREDYTELDIRPYRSPGAKTVSYWLAQHMGRVQLTAFVKTGVNRREWNARFGDF